MSILREELFYRDILDVPPDIQELVRLWRNSDHVRKNMVSSNLISEQQHADWLAFLKGHPERQILRVAFYQETPFGIITLKDMDEYASRSDWGMYIGEITFLGKGFARPMLFDLLAWAFDEKGFKRLFTSVLGDNAKAIALYLDFGFHLEGRFEKHILRESGDLVDLYWLACFREQWSLAQGEASSISGITKG